MTVKIGLVGAGAITERHLVGYLAARERAKITAVADVDLDRAKVRAAEAGGAATYSDYRELLTSEDVDAVDICLPHHLHAEAIITAAGSGKHIICEKPLCLSMTEATMIADRVAANGVTLMCAHNHLFIPSVQKARELIEAGQVGRIFEVETTDAFLLNVTAADMGWRAFQGTSGGGELIDTGYHPSYLLLHLADGEPVEVAAMLAAHRLTFAEGEDSARVLVRFDSGVIGSIVTSWAYDPARGIARHFTVLGEDGSLAGTPTSLTFKRRGGKSSEIQLPQTTMSQTITAEIDHFVGCLEHGTRPINTEVEGIRTLRVILAAYRSEREKRTVAVAEI